MPPPPGFGHSLTAARHASAATPSGGFFSTLADGFSNFTTSAQNAWNQYPAFDTGAGDNIQARSSSPNPTNAAGGGQQGAEVAGPFGKLINPFLELGKSATGLVTQYYQTKADIQLARAAAAGKTSPTSPNFNPASVMSGGDLIADTGQFDRETYLANSLVNSAGRQFKRLAGDAFDSFLPYIIVGGAAIFIFVASAKVGGK